MRSVSRGLMKSLSLVLIMLVSVLSPLSYNSTTELLQEISSESAGEKSSPVAADVPVWRVGDKWKYAGAFDPTQLVIDSGVDANVGEIYGDSITEVLSINEQTFNGQPTLVYTIRTSANFDKSGHT